jgi:hypothetical protein
LYGHLQGEHETLEAFKAHEKALDGEVLSCARAEMYGRLVRTHTVAAQWKGARVDVTAEVSSLGLRCRAKRLVHVAVTAISLLPPAPIRRRLNPVASKIDERGATGVPRQPSGESGWGGVSGEAR